MKVKIREVSYHDLATNHGDRYGIVKLGAGGDLQEWVRGMEEVLRENSVVNGMVATGELWDDVLLITTKGRQDLVFLASESKMPRIRVWLWKAPNHIDDVMFLNDYLQDDPTGSRIR